MIKPVSGQIKS